ncbi:winged helix-turn-helix transcriptional regulator [Weissella diestrammenae]|uniref:Winged helix-turn-helix transcriptional regulator n=1 Tax=Weissella diestrammenae TaxID=1162633 RepID=A0A7G9T5M7_9LACO|nr:winged helix-turn-helix transcriptional regulator [Weissella diestrammenae]QNN75402.1 winged helix-turn-helix transcriptional regulator [Weissella diestrammenae]
MKAIILCSLHHQPVRSTELLRVIPNISRKVLNT